MYHYSRLCLYRGSLYSQDLLALSFPCHPRAAKACFQGVNLLMWKSTDNAHWCAPSWRLGPVTGCGARHQTVLRVILLVVQLLCIAAEAHHAAAGQNNAPTMWTMAPAGVATYTVQTSMQQAPSRIPTVSLSETPTRVRYVPMMQPVGTTQPRSGMPTGTMAAQQQMQAATNPATGSASGTGTEAGSRQQQGMSPPPPAAGASSDADTDDEESMVGSENQIGVDPFETPPPPPAQWQQQQQQQQQQPRRPGRTWDQKFPFPQCANATLMFDVAFVGKVQYAQVGTVRYAYHQFGPLSDSPAEDPPRGGFSAAFKDSISPVVFISGWGMSMYMWPVPLLKALAATRTVVIFDNMRTGGSTDTSRQQLTIPMMADSTAGLIQKLNLDKPDIWSWSLGAAVGYALLARHSNKLGNVILAAGTPGGPNALLPPASVWQQATAAGQDYIKVLPLLFPDSELDQGVCNLYASFNSFSPAGKLTSPLGRQSLEEQGSALLAFFNDASVIGKLKDIPNRALILHGVQDRVMPIRNAVLGAQHLLGSWMLQFPGEGHAIPFSNLQAVIATTQEFFTFASPLSSSNLKSWANYGNTYSQHLSQRGTPQPFGR